MLGVSPVSNGRWYFYTCFYSCDIATGRSSIIDILCEGGTVLQGVRSISFQTMRHLLEDGVVPDEGFVELTFEDGSRGLIKKKSIIGFYEAENTQV